MVDWLSYEWEWANRQAVFRVDMQYWELLPALGYQHLLYVCCAPRKPSAAAFTHTETVHAQQLPALLAERFASRIIHVGSVSADNLIQHYYYTAEPDLIAEFSALCRSDAKLPTTCGHMREPKFVTYYRFLFPDDAKLQSIENETFIKSLKLNPAALALVRRVNLVFSFLTVETRTLFLNQARDLGLLPLNTFMTSNKTHPFCATVTGFSSLLLPELNRYTARVICAAAPMDGMLADVKLG